MRKFVFELFLHTLVYMDDEGFNSLIKEVTAIRIIRKDYPEWEGWKNLNRR